MPAQLVGIYRYPIKGMHAEALEHVTITKGARLPEDRRYALAHGAQLISGDQGGWQPKHRFVTLVHQAALATLGLRICRQEGWMEITRRGTALARAQPQSATGRLLLGQCLSDLLPERRRPLKLVIARSDAFTDMRAPYLSLLNLASLRQLETLLKRPLGPARFRANLIVDGLAPWSEIDWIGQEVDIGGLRFRAEQNTSRCAATDVDSKTGQRSGDLPRTLKQLFATNRMGIYLTACSGGILTAGDLVCPPTLKSPALT